MGDGPNAVGASTNLSTENNPALTGGQKAEILEQYGRSGGGEIDINAGAQRVVEASTYAEYQNDLARADEGGEVVRVIGGAFDARDGGGVEQGRAVENWQRWTPEQRRRDFHTSISAGTDGTPPNEVWAGFLLEKGTLQGQAVIDGFANDSYVENAIQDRFGARLDSLFEGDGTVTVKLQSGESRSFDGREALTDFIREQMRNVIQNDEDFDPALGFDRFAASFLMRREGDGWRVTTTVELPGPERGGDAATHEEPSWTPPEHAFWDPALGSFFGPAFSRDLARKALETNNVPGMRAGQLQREIDPSIGDQSGFNDDGYNMAGLPPDTRARLSTGYAIHVQDYLPQDDGTHERQRGNDAWVSLQVNGGQPLLRLAFQDGDGIQEQVITDPDHIRATLAGLGGAGLPPSPGAPRSHTHQRGAGVVESLLSVNISRIRSLADGAGAFRIKAMAGALEEIQNAWRQL